MTTSTTLQRTLSLHFLVAAILPILFFGVIAISVLHRHLQEGVYARNEMLARDIAASAEQFLREVERDLDMVAGIAGSATIVRPEAVNGYLEAFVKRSGRFESIYLLDRQHRVRHLGLSSRTSLHSEDYYLSDFSQHPLFHKYAVIDRPVWSDTFVSLVTGEPSVTLAIPIRDGTLFGIVSLQSLSHQFARFAMAPGDNCAIVDHIGALVASSDPALTMQRVNLSDHRVIRDALQGDEKTFKERHAGGTLLESAAQISSTGWVAWVGVDLDEKMAPVVHFRNLLAGGMFLAMLLAACMALVDARRLMRPLATLSERAEEIGAGHYDMAVAQSGFSEIDNLAVRLEQMSQSVRDRESSLVDSEQRFRDLVNSIDGVVWELDVHSGRYLFVSNQSLTLFGYPAEQWLEDPDFWARHVHKDDQERVVIRGRRSLALNEKHDLEYRLIVADGQPLWVRDLVTVIWAGEEPLRLLGVIIDISGRKQAEQELQLYREHLEELVVQRTRELEAAQSELVQKERLAVLGQLTATVSHEIRNPLGTVANSLYLLRDLLDDAALGKVERPLALAERSVQRCDGIISELLDFTRRRELQSESLELDRWLAGVLDELQWPPGLERHCRFASAAIVQADPERLRRALVNVIDNALQAMEGHAEKSLDISTARADNRCLIVIGDTGCGIPAEIMEKIFEPLFSTKNFGVGLGVPIIRNIMTDHGGGVDYRSEVGGGTTVTLWLPLPGPFGEA